MKVKTVDILGIRFNLFEKKECRLMVRNLLLSATQETIYTPNAEMLVYASHDSNFKEILNRSSINICDGSGPAYLTKIFQKQTIQRITGVDCLHDVLHVANESNKSVFLLGTGDTDVLKAATQTFRQKFKELRIVGTHHGISLDLAETRGVHTLVYDEHEMSEMQSAIIMAAPDILIVGFGHPKQELFIDTFIEEFPTVQMAMGVGGSLDFYAGKVKRAPLWMRKIGLESIWRLIVEPWRWKRVCTALIIFPILYIKNYYVTKIN